MDKDLNTLQTEFKSAWNGVKSLLDQQADELRNQSVLIDRLLTAQNEHEEVLKTLIDKLN